MITVGMNYQVLPGRQADFEQKFEAVLEALRGAAGHVRSQLYRDVHDDASYLIISEWDDQQRFTQFIRSQAFREVTDWGREHVLAERPRHRVFTQERAV